ncbi:MAG: Gfo/Idh/MocA family oxidoreductase [Phycisphaerae bacterium]|nr:Gfo/Idh/MocA family oxidoreductase [Phycisphaerae bacterium]
MEWYEDTLEKKNKLNIGFVGLNFGHWVIEEQILSGPGAPLFDLVGICDQNVALLKSRAVQYGVRAFDSLDSILAEKNIDVIGLFTPPVGRAELVRRVIRAGKHVITTKPFERNSAAALAVLQEARSLGRTVHINSPGPLLTADWQQVEHWRRQYNLGRPIAAHFSTWASYREKPDGTWLDDPERCPVAPIFRLGIYSINDMVRLLGPAESVQVAGTRLMTGRATSDNAHLTLQFKNAAIGSIFASFCVNDGNFYADTMVLNFENGTVYINAGAPGQTREIVPLQLVLRAGETCRVVDQGVVPRAKRAGSYQWDVLYRAISGEQIADVVTPEQVAHAIAIVEAMAIAQQSQRCERVGELAGESPASTHGAC